MSSVLKLSLQDANTYIRSRKKKNFVNTSTQYILQQKKEIMLNFLCRKKYGGFKLTLSNVGERLVECLEFPLICRFSQLEYKLRNTRLCPCHHRALDIFYILSYSSFFSQREQMNYQNPTVYWHNIRKLRSLYLYGVVHGTNCI